MDIEIALITAAECLIRVFRI